MSLLSLIVSYQQVRTLFYPDGAMGLISYPVLSHEAQTSILFAYSARDRKGASRIEETYGLPDRVCRDRRRPCEGE